VSCEVPYLLLLLTATASEAAKVSSREMIVSLKSRPSQSSKLAQRAKATSERGVGAGMVGVS
jgi:hypothetical protein